MNASQIIGILLGAIFTSTLTIIINQIRIKNKVREELEAYRQEMIWLMEEFPLHKHIGGDIYYPARVRIKGPTGKNNG